MADSIKKRASVSTSAKHRDAGSPTPWRVVDLRSKGNCTVDIYDATGHRVFMWAKVTPTDAADLDLIIEAVNGVEATRKLQRTLLGWSLERDRLRDEFGKVRAALERANRYGMQADEDNAKLRDLVRRLLDEIDRYAKEDGYYSDSYDLLREARETIGKEEP